MADWRELPAGRELDILIAKMAGYRVINWNAENLFGVKVKQPNTDMLLKPGEAIPDVTGIDGRFAAWGKSAWELAPHFSTNMTATQELLNLYSPYHPGCHFWFSPTTHRWNACFDQSYEYRRMENAQAGRLMPSIEMSGDTLMLAACRAWLAFADKSKPEDLSNDYHQRGR